MIPVKKKKIEQQKKKLPIFLEFVLTIKPVQTLFILNKSYLTAQLQSVTWFFIFKMFSLMCSNNSRLACSAVGSVEVIYLPMLYFQAMITKSE